MSSGKAFKFEAEVDGKVFWPIIIVMLAVLVPIVMVIR
jgi:hypothetical protein